MDIPSIIRTISVVAIPVIFAITIHEVAHGWVALRLGDRTAKQAGRLTLNPVKHIDPIGTLLLPISMLLISGGAWAFGWAKPVPVAFHRLNNPRMDMILVAAAGPGANLLMAMGWALILGFVVQDFVSLSSGEWLVNVPLTFSSLTNPVAYENVCVECTLSLVPLSDIQNDFECADADFPVVFRSQLLDFYGVPVEGATVQLLALGTQGGPTFEALVIQDEVFGCFQDNALFGTPGEYDEGVDQLNDATSFEQCTADQQDGCFFDLDDDGIYNNDDWEIDLSEEECPNVTAEICFNDVDGSGDWNDDESLYPEFNASQCNQLGGNHIMFEFGAYEWGTIVESEFSWGVIQGALTFEAVQKKTKVGVHDKECIPKVKELIKFYQNFMFFPNAFQNLLFPPFGRPRAPKSRRIEFFGRFWEPLGF